MRRLALAALALAAGCGDDGGVAAPMCGGDAGIGPDLGTVDTSESNVHLSPMMKNIFLEVFLDPASIAPDLIELELYADTGVFDGGAVRTGTFALSGDETRYDRCGACVLLLVDRDPGSLTPKAYFMPVSGTLRLDSVAGRLTGLLEDVVLRQVTIDLDDPDGPDGSAQPSLLTTDVPGGCRTRFGRAAFDVPIE